MGEGGQIAFFLTWLTSSPSRSWAPGLPWLVALRPYKRVSPLCVPFSRVFDTEPKPTPYLSHADFTWPVYGVVCEG